MQKAAIVILNYNGVEMLRQFLPDVCGLSRYPVFVIDNGSTDSSITYLREHHPSVRILLLAENHGYAGGYNRGLEQIRGEFEFYILLNSDVQVREGWDLPLIRLMDISPHLASVQPKILSFQNPSLFDYAGAAGGFIDQLGYPYCRGRIFDNIEMDRGQYEDSVPVDWTSGACMAVRDGLFHQHGGFDERFFAHMEEVDICWRWRADGYECRYLAESVVFHVGGATLSRSNPRKTYLNFRNNLWMLKKNLSKGRFLYIYVCRVALDFLAVLVFAMRGKMDEAKAVVDAHISFLGSRASVPHPVPKVAQQISVAGRVSILFDYYLMGKKIYSDL